MQEIKIKVGDTVIRKDGLKGRIVKAKPDNDFEYSYVIAEVKCENGRTIFLSMKELSDYYLIGHTVLGNKATEEELEHGIADCDKKIGGLKSQKKQLRKQLWRLKEEMVEDWKERRQARMNKKENQHTEEDTED